ncbi:MAG: pentapeptide repeat-containing protein, partial [Chloroflexi bacterium]|nr:pentapeptide repeat-containing protein [Chloroflexota bacterium]
MANPEHVVVVKQGAEAIRAWRAKGEECRLDLREADLRHAGLNDADLRSAMLTEANLI